MMVQLSREVLAFYAFYAWLFSIHSLFKSLDKAARATFETVLSHILRVGDLMLVRSCTPCTLDCRTLQHDKHTESI